jgi:anti-sigma regulatory factor (Ser/Thr protein kinase)
VFELRTTLPGEAASPAAGRTFVSDALARWGCEHLIEVARLLTSELVTNAIIHEHSEVLLVVGLHQGVVRVEVHDGEDGELLVIPGQPGPEDTGGRGLLLVDAMADHWGVERELAGKSVWFETGNAFPEIDLTTKTPSPMSKIDTSNVPPPRSTTRIV